VEGRRYEPGFGRPGPLMDREHRELAAKVRNFFAREHLQAGVLKSLQTALVPPPIDILRVGDGAIITIRADIGEDVARDVREIVGDMIEDGVARFILEVDGPGSVSAPLLALLTEVAEVSAVARVHLSLVVSGGETAASVRGSSLGEDIPVFLTGVHTERAGH
jgi:predicted metal-dependent peptidase